jgi:hypothetical protein
MALPNLRLSSAVLGGLAQPDFARAAGLSIGAGMLGAQRRADEAETRATQEASIELLRKAQVAQETGDMGMLGNINDELDALLSTTRNEQARQAIMESIETVQGQRGATQQQAQTNTAMSIIKTEQALEQFKQQDARRASGELVEVAPFEERQRKVLEERLAQMKQNGAAVVEADNIKYQTKFEALKRQNELAEQQKQIVMRALSSTKFGSDQYKQDAEQLRKQGFGQAVDKYETTQYALIEAKEKADEIRRSKADLSPAEEKMLRDNNFEPTGDIRRDRDRLALISETLDKRKIAMANRQSGEVSDVKAHVQLALEALKKGGDIPGNILSSDLYNKIDKLLEDPDEVDKIVGLLQRPKGEGLSSIEIQNEVAAYIQRKFPEEFKEAKDYQDTQIAQSQKLEFLTLDLMAEAGLADRNDDGTITVKEGVKEEDIALFRREAEQRTSVTGTIIRAITSPKDETALSDIEIYSPTF